MSTWPVFDVDEASSGSLNFDGGWSLQGMAKASRSWPGERDQLRGLCDTLVE